MGYSARTVTAENVKKAIADATMLLNLPRVWCTTAYQVIYKCEINLTDADYLWYSIYNSSGNSCVLKIDFGVTNILEDTIPATTADSVQTDVSAYTGDHTVIVSIKTLVAAKRIDGVTVWFTAA